MATGIKNRWQLENFPFNKFLLSAIEWSRDAERLAVSDSLGRVSVVRLAEAEPRVEHLLTGRGSWIQIRLDHRVMTPPSFSTRSERK
jgi:hypothetical protein